MSTRAQEIHKIIDEELAKAFETGGEIPDVMLVGPKDLKALVDEVKQMHQTYELQTEEEQLEAARGIVGRYLSPTGHVLSIVVMPKLDDLGLMLGQIVDGRLLLRRNNG